MVSMAFASNVILPLDASASIIRKDLPQGLLGTFNDQFNNKGVIFEPKDRPATACGYTFDADTDGRAFGPDQNRCGRSNEFPLLSDKCPNFPAFQTPQEYADMYFFKPINTNSGDWAPNVGQCYDKGDPRVTLDKQKEVFLKIATDATAKDQWNDPVLSLKKPSFYNEFVLKDKPTDPQIAAYVWAHAGPFFNDIKDCPNNGGTYTCELCAIQMEFCRNGQRPDKPLIEIANQFFGVGGCVSNDPSYDMITAYEDVVAKGGYDADMIFRELSWDDVCGPGKEIKSGLRPPFRALCKRNGQ